MFISKFIYTNISESCICMTYDYLLIRRQEDAD